MKPSVCFMIPTTSGRETVLQWVVRHLCMDVPYPFHLHIYNDHGKPLIPTLYSILRMEKRDDVELFVYNDTGRLNPKKSGAAGARRLMFEQIKRKYEIVVSLDDDMQLKPNWLENILEAMNKFPNHNVFTGIVKGTDDKIQFAGSKFTIKDQTLYRQELIAINGEYNLTDWGPIGCMALCRSALSDSISIPPIYIRDDASLFLELRRFGWNETVVVAGAESIHKPIPVPSSNLRLKDELEKEAIFFQNTYGLKFGY